MNKKIVSAIVLIIIASIIVIFENMENQKNSEVNLTLYDLKYKLNNNEILTPIYFKNVAKNEFGKGDKSDYLYKVKGIDNDTEYNLTELQDLEIYNNENSFKILSSNEQKLEKKKVEFMILFLKSYRSYIDSIIENGLTKENFKKIGKVYSEWLDILYSNGNIDPVTSEGIIIYTYCVDTVAFDGYNMKRIRDILLLNRYEKEKYFIERTMKIMDEHRKRYDSEISRYYDYID